MADLARDMLTDAGVADVLVATGTAEALALLQQAAPVDIAIVDVKLGGASDFRLAEMLVANGIRFIFATGYAGLPPAWRKFPLLTKPYTAEMLVEALTRALR